MNWERITLGDICHPKQWKTISKKKLLKEGYPVYGANGRIGFSEKFTHEKPIILVGCRGTCGSINVTEPYSYANGNAMALDSLDESKVDLYFLKYILQKRGFKDVISGTSQPQIIRQNIVRVDILLPPIEEQRRIAKILDTVSQLYLKSETRLKSLIKLTDSDFHELISSLNSSTNTSRYPLGELCEVNSGITKGRKLKEDKKITMREIPYMAVLNVQDKQLNLDQVKTIAVTEEEIEKFRLSLDDLLLTEGGDPDKLGRGTIWKGEIKECIHQNHIFRVRAKSKNLNMEYISWLISSEYGKKYFLRCAKQTTGIATINKTQLKEFPVLLPSDNQLQRFQKLMTNLNTTQNNMNKANQLFKNLVESMSASHLKSKEK